MPRGDEDDVVLIDTSAWIHFLRPDGVREVRARVEVALQAGTARSCAFVRLELWNGAGGTREKRVLRDLERDVPDLPIDTVVWEAASDLARRCRNAGVSVPATDLLIAACARHHGAGIEHDDADFERIAQVVNEAEAGDEDDEAL